VTKPHNGPAIPFTTISFTCAYLQTRCIPSEEEKKERKKKIKQNKQKKILTLMVENKMFFPMKMGELRSPTFRRHMSFRPMY
jgi:hypothetical protein